jgi:hypothetical protein
MAKVKFNLEADEAKAVNAFLRVVDAQNKTERGMRGINSKTKEQDGLFGKVSSSVKGYLASFAAAGAVVQGIRMINEELDRNVQLTKTAERSRSLSLSLAAGDPETAKFIKDAEKQYMATSGSTAEEAANAVFGIRSVFATEDQQQQAVDFSSKADRMLRSSGKFAEGLGTIMNALGEAETGNVAQLGNKLIAAANVSKTDASEFGNELSRIAKTGASVGAGDEILSSALAFGSASQKSAAEASTRLRALMVDMKKEGIQGDTFEEKFENMLASGITGSNALGKFTNNVEAAEGFQMVYDDWNRIKKLKGDLDREGALAGTDGSLLNRSLGLLANNPEVELPYQNRVNKAQIDQVMENFGIQKLARENAVQEAILAREKMGNFGPADKVVMQYVGGFLSNLPLDPSTVGGITDFIGRPADKAFDEIAPKLAETLEKLDRSIETMNQNMAKQPKLPMARNNGMVE